MQLCVNYLNRNRTEYKNKTTQKSKYERTMNTIPKLLGSYAVKINQSVILEVQESTIFHLTNPELYSPD